MSRRASSGASDDDARFTARRLRSSIRAGGARRRSSASPRRSGRTARRLSAAVRACRPRDVRRLQRVVRPGGVRRARAVPSSARPAPSDGVVRRSRRRAGAGVSSDRPRRILRDVVSATTGRAACFTGWTDRRHGLLDRPATAAHRPPAATARVTGSRPAVVGVSRPGRGARWYVEADGACATAPAQRTG